MDKKQSIDNKWKLMLKYAYPLGDAAFAGDWNRYWEIHKRMRKDCWSIPKRVAFRVGSFVAWIKGDKLKP